VQTFDSTIADILGGSVASTAQYVSKR
jgi:hypothetical protein